MRRRYNSEFKGKAVELAERLDSPVQAAEKLGISVNNLYSWIKENEKSKRRSPSQPSPAELEAELKALRKENQNLKRSNEILKYAAAFFSQETLK